MSDSAADTTPTQTPTIPPARTSPGVAVTAGSGYVTMLASSIEYLGPWNWPLAAHAPTDVQALGLAGLIIGTGATLFHLWANKA